MTKPSTPRIRSWLIPERAWTGPKALVPVETCYRILDRFLWLVALFAALSLVFLYERQPTAIRAYPLFWVNMASVIPLLLAAVFRGWPFTVRYVCFAGGLGILLLTATATLGLFPNWAFLVIFCISTASLFYGVRFGFLMLSVITLLHVILAAGWLTGRLPPFGLDISVTKSLVDFTEPLVWLRVLILATGLLAALVLLMRYVLADLNNALRDTKRSLAQLAVEQEYRARAEEARMQAERRAVEAQKFDALGRLAGGVAHDINNALCVVKCWNGVLSIESSDPLVKEAMQAIGVATESAEQLTQQLRTIGCADMGKAEHIELAAAIHQESRTLARMLPKGIKVDFRSAGPVHVRFSHGKLQELILNLCLNARDAMPAGGKLSLRVGRQAGAADSADGVLASMAVIEVEDTGTGMEESVRARIFEPFFTTKEPGKGTGLGLAMVYGLVKGAGGHVEVRSAPGQGTCFIITLPETEPGSVVPAKIATQAEAGRSGRVLVVDGSLEIRNLVARILTGERYPVALAADGIQAMTEIKQGSSPVELLIVDDSTPGLSTNELITLALASNPACQIIISSWHQRTEEVRSGIDAGHYHWLPKPFEAAQLRTAVKTAFSEPAG